MNTSRINNDRNNLILKFICISNEHLAWLSVASDLLRMYWYLDIAQHIDLGNLPRLSSKMTLLSSHTYQNIVQKDD